MKAKFLRSKKFYFLLFLSIGIFLLNTIDISKLLVFKMSNAPLNEKGLTLAEQLGYDKNTKLLVVNSDDTAAHPTFMDGVFETMKSGVVKSTSILVHDHNEQEIEKAAAISKLHPNWSFGVHLMLTNEYQNRYPWKPVLPKSKVPSLYNSEGLAWEKIEEVEKFANPKEVFLELDAQVQKALRLGLEVSHLDSHMGTVYRNSYYPGADIDDLRMAAVKVAKKYNLPITVNTFDKDAQAIIQYIDNNQIIRPDTFFGFYELEEMNAHMSYKGSKLKKWITALVVNFAFAFDIPYENKLNVSEDVPVRIEILKSALKKIVKPGLNHFYMHAASEEHTNEIKIPNGFNHKTGLDRIVRLADAEVWSSDEMKSFLENEKIVIINYNVLKELMEQRKQ